MDLREPEDLKKITTVKGQHQLSIEIKYLVCVCKTITGTIDFLYDHSNTF